MGCRRRLLFLQLSLALWVIFVLSVPAWPGPGSDRMMARADRLISQTSRLLLDVDRLMSRDLEPPSSERTVGLQVAAFDLPPDNAMSRSINDPGRSPSGSFEGASDGLRPFERKSEAESIASTIGSHRADSARSLAEYREISRRLDNQLEKADQLIARTAQLMGQADRVLAQATPPAESDAPASTEKAPATSKDQPDTTKNGTQQESSGSGTTSPAAPIKDQPAVEGAPKDKPAAEGAPKDKPAAAGAAKDQPASGATAQQQEEEREVARVPLAAVQAGGLLLPRDSLIVEPTIFYTYSQNTRLIVTGFSVLPLIILGSFESERLTNNLVSPALQLRYGLYRGLQLDFRVPYTYANQSRLRVSTENAGQVEESQHDSGIGDVSFGLTYQFLYERGWLPDLMFRIGASAPTGKSQFDIFQEIASKGGLVSAEAFLNALNTSGIATGAGRWTYSASINGVKALDPGILFGTVGWNYTPESTESLIQVSATPVTGGVVLQPTLVSSRLGAVNSFQGSIGLAISLNNQLSVNFSVSELLSAATKANGIKIPGSATNIGQFNFGMNLAVSPTTTINFVSSIGITPDSPNLSLLLSVPVFFNNVGENTYGFLKSTITDLFRRKPAPVEKPKEEKPKEKPKEGATG